MINPVTPTDITLMNVIGWDTTTGGLPPPSIAVNVHNVSVGENASIPAALLIASLTNPNGDSVTQYVFEDEGSGDGHFTVNGTTQADDQLIDVPAADLSNIQYVGGSSPGSETLTVAAYDSTTASYSDFSSLTAATTAPGATLTAAQIDTVYSDVLGRAAAAAEQAAWVAAESSGPLSAAQVIAGIVNSSEAQAYSWAVVRLYQAAFGRVPDPAGFTGPGRRLDPASGGSGDDLSAGEQPSWPRPNSKPATEPRPATHAALTVFIQALYENVLGRAGSTAEVDAWLATGDSAAQMLVGFSGSPEFQARANPAVASLLTINALAETVVTGPLFQTAITGASSAQTSGGC